MARKKKVDTTATEPPDQAARSTSSNSTLYLKVRTFSDGVVDAWLMERDGDTNSWLLYGSDMSSQRADWLAAQMLALGLLVEREQMLYPGKVDKNAAASKKESQSVQQADLFGG